MKDISVVNALFMKAPSSKLNPIQVFNIMEVSNLKRCIITYYIKLKYLHDTTDIHVRNQHPITATTRQTAHTSPRVASDFSDIQKVKSKKGASEKAKFYQIRKITCISTAS